MTGCTQSQNKIDIDYYKVGNFLMPVCSLACVHDYVDKKMKNVGKDLSKHLEKYVNGTKVKLVNKDCVAFLIAK